MINVNIIQHGISKIALHCVRTLLPSMLILRVLVSHAWLSSSSVGNSAEPNSCVWGADTPDREESATTPHTCVDSV